MQYNAKVNVLRIARTSDGMGGWDEALHVLHNNLPCRITWTKGMEKIQFQKDTHYSDGNLFCRVIDVTEKDRVVYNSKTYEIMDVANPDNKSRSIKLILRLIE